MLLAYYIHDLSPFLLQFGSGFGLRWYGLAYVAAFACGYLLYRNLSRRGFADLPEKQIGDFIAWWVVLGTLLGGRLGYMFLYDFGGFLENPLSIFKVWEGGMSAHGGMLGLVAATWLYSRKYRISWLNLGDNLTVTAPLGLFFGRCANFINGELYGRAATVPWAVQFPKELYSDPAMASRVIQESGSISLDVLIETGPHTPALREILASILTPRHPSQIYEAAIEGLLLFAILWILRTRFLFPNGVLTGVFFMGYAILRSIAEIFREPDSTMIFSLTRGQFYSIFLFLIGVAFLIFGILRPSYPLKFQKSKRKEN